MSKTHIPFLLSVCLLGSLAAQAQRPQLFSFPFEQKNLLAWGWQGETILSVSADGVCRRWTSDGVCRDSFVVAQFFPENPTAVFTQNCQFLLFQTSASSFGVWDVPARTKFWEKQVGGEGISSLAISPNNRFMAVAYTRGLAVFDSTGVEIARFQDEKTPASIAVSDKGTALVTYPADATGRKMTKIWGPDAQNWQLQDRQNALVQPVSKPAEAATKRSNFPKTSSSAATIAAKVNPEKSEPLPATTAAKSPEKTAAPVAALPAPEPVEESAKTVPVVRKNAGFAVVVGTFGVEANARKRLTDAQRWGFKNASISEKTGKFSVVADVLDTHEAAWRVKRSLEEKFGISAAVVRMQ